MMYNGKKSRAAIGFFLSLISCFSLFAMDVEQKEKPFLFLNLLPEHQERVWDYLTINSSGPPKITTKTLNSFARVNQKYNTLLNNPVHSKKLIKDLAKSFQCSDEEVVEGLQTQEAKRVQKQQDILFALCTPTGICCAVNNLLWVPCRENKLYKHKTLLGLCLSFDECQEIIKKGVDCDKCPQVHKLRLLIHGDTDFEFTYNRKNYIKNITPFMALCSTSSHENKSGLLQIMEFFIEQHKQERLNINAINWEGMSGWLCIFASNDNFTTDCAANSLCKSKLANVNQRDNQGNTALMHYLLKGSMSMLVFKYIIEAGVDPRIANNAGITPLKQLKYIEESCGGTMDEERDYLKSVIRGLQ